jgi:tRNA dimethylallyltransferase
VSISDPLLVVLAGPTGSGKTSLSLSIAERLGGEIVSCDSVALYRDFDIGTAKPTAAERNRISHHLIDVADPTEIVTAGDYARRARQALAEIRQRQKLPIVVGGTGLYLRALLEGLFAGPQRSEALRERLRERAEAKGPEHTHRILRRLDPVAAGRIHANDLAKVIRAIEVCLGAKAPMTGMWNVNRERLQGFRIQRIGLNPDRKALYARINARCERMFAAGLIEETRMLREKYGDAVWPMSALGYRQAAEFLRGERNLQQSLEATQQAHRNYAKRQMTWFRRDPEITWLDGFGDDPSIVLRALDLASK